MFGIIDYNGRKQEKREGTPLERDIMRLEPVRNEIRRLAWLAFFLGIGMALCFILPFWIADGRFYATFSDYVTQQVPFNIFSNESLKRGEIFWDWYTDLGGSFVGGYSFYTLGSPFCWLLFLFPSWLEPYLMPLANALKYGVSAATAFLYVQRFAENKRYALIGALLYAFSGFQATNLGYNHFHDAVAFFPLLLIALEDRIEGKKHLYFCLAVALNAMVNYFFFVGEAVFCVMYFCVRTFGFLPFRDVLRRAGRCMAEGILGVGLSAVIFLPGILYILGHPSASRFPYGMRALFYDPYEFLAVVRAYFFANEAMNGCTTLTASYPDSTALFLPFTGLLPAFLYIKRNPGQWLKRLLILCMLCTFIPVLNSLFVGLTATAYRRWYYMFILVLALAVTVQLEKCEEYPEDLVKKAAFAYFLIFFLFVAFVCFWPVDSSGSVLRQSGGVHLIYQVGISVFGTAGVLWLMRRGRQGKQILPLLLVGIVAVSVLNHCLTLYRNKQIGGWDRGAEIHDCMMAGEALRLPEEENFRIISDYDEPNLNLYMRRMSASNYNTTANTNIYSLYELTDIPRGNQSYVYSDNLALKTLLSVRFEVMCQEQPDRVCYDSYEGDALTFYVYENEMALPIGFVYQHYIPMDELMSFSPKERELLLLRAVVAGSEDEKALSRYLSPLPEDRRTDLSEEAVEADYRERKAQSSKEFSHSTRGFHAVIQCEEGGMAYFTVPFDKGWSATVNGEAVPVYCSAGMMLVPVKAGENVIEASYFPRELALGAGVSALSLAVLAVLFCVQRTGNARRSRKERTYTA